MQRGRGDNRGTILAGLGSCLCLGSVGLGVVLLLQSWANISPTEVALKYSTFSQSVDPNVLTTPGTMFVGPFTKLLKYSKAIQTIEFTAGDGDLLDGRTSDGLPLMLGLSFQYRLIPEQLFQLYTRYEQKNGDYVRFFRLIGIHFVTELATKYTANEFFNEKQRIANEMKVELNQYYSANLGATIESVQINEDDLPEPFTNALLEAQVISQRKSKMDNVKSSKMVEFQTAVLVAESQANVTAQKAEGEVHQITQNGKADAAIIKTFVEAELGAYGHIVDEMELTGDELVQYIWYDTLGGGSVGASSKQTHDLTVFMNVDPSAFISAATPALQRSS